MRKSTVMDDRLKESLWFYTGADYLIINAFLWINKEAMDPCIGIVWQNNRDVIREAKEEGPENRFAFSGLDGAALFESYRRRTPAELTNEAKRDILHQAITDIRLICDSMHPIREPVRLFRNMEAAFCLKNIREGEQVDLLGLTSTSTTGQQINYGQNNFRKPAQILQIDVPSGLPALFLENDEHEVLLPPMRYRVKGEHIEDGVLTVSLDACQPLELERLIQSATEAFAELFDVHKQDTARR